MPDNKIANNKNLKISCNTYLGVGNLTVQRPRRFGLQRFMTLYRNKKSRKTGDQDPGAEHGPGTTNGKPGAKGQEAALKWNQGGLTEPEAEVPRFDSKRQCGRFCDPLTHKSQPTPS